MTSMQEPNSRRDFFRHSAAATLAASCLTGVMPSSAQAKEEEKEKKDGDLFSSNPVVLFQGDSITDAKRSREEQDQANLAAALGTGYALAAAMDLLANRPGSEMKIYNRGISGNKVFQLAERWQADCLDLKPDLLSILIGVNDFWHVKSGKYDGTREKYETDYRDLLKKTKEALPEVQLVICEPFLLACGAVEAGWIGEFEGYRAAAKKLAKEFEAVFVPFQEMFDKAAKKAPAAYWAADGVHPTPAGSYLMAQEWLKTVGKKGKMIKAIKSITTRIR